MWWCGGGKMNLETKAGARQWEHFGSYMGSHRRFKSRDVIDKIWILGSIL